MSSLIEELQRREAAARQEVDELRGEIARLNERLARAEEALSRLEITRETVAEILGGAGPERAAAGPVAGSAAVGRPAPPGSTRARGLPVGGGERAPRPPGPS